MCWKWKRFRRKWLNGECRHFCRFCKYRTQCEIMYRDEIESIKSKFNK